MFENLNEQQRQAVQTVNGRVLILAGAGSGKTKVLTVRMAHLIKNHNVSPKSILGLTFTNKAAAEMRHRIAQLVDESSAKQVTLSTFHSFCMQILRSDIHRLGYTNNFSLYDETDVQRLVNYITRDEIQCDKDLPSLQETMSIISNAKNKGLAAEAITYSQNQWHENFARTLYQRLQDCMRAYNAVDFDNLLLLTVELFEKHPDVLQKYQERYRYIMIDEYQDTNPIQYRLASLLAAKYENLCVVGDDDQSIYGWRGADVRNILDFDRATVIKLEQNYRSMNSILKAANKVISHNTNRHSKMLWSTRGEGDPIEVFVAPTDADEAQAVVCRIAKLKETKGLRWKDFAILYRSNALSRQFELALMKHTWKNGDRWVIGIPYQVYGGVEFYERREVKDLFAYLRVIVNPLDQEALLRIINQPRRGVGEGALDKLTAYNRTKNIPLWQVIKDVCDNSENTRELREACSGKALHGLADFVAIIENAKERFAQPQLHESLRWLIEKIDYRKAIQEEVKSDQMRNFKWENVQEFVNALAEFDKNSLLEGGDHKGLQDFITSMPLQNNWDASLKKNNRKDDMVNLLTFHSAKGLEFPACFLVGMEDHIIPHEKSMRETGIEEERRLMYVAITRAMKHLTISMAQRRMRMGKDEKSNPSRFVYEIPQELLKPTNWHQF